MPDETRSDVEQQRPHAWRRFARVILMIGIVVFALWLLFFDTNVKYGWVEITVVDEDYTPLPCVGVGMRRELLFLPPSGGRGYLPAYQEATDGNGHWEEVNPRVTGFYTAILFTNAQRSTSIAERSFVIIPLYTRHLQMKIERNQLEAPDDVKRCR